jgi:hypothetical protein
MTFHLQVGEMHAGAPVDPAAEADEVADAARIPEETVRAVLARFRVVPGQPVRDGGGGSSIPR